MHKSSLTRWVGLPLVRWPLVAVVMVGVFGARVDAAPGAVSSAASADSHPHLISTMQAAGPHPSLGANASAFARLVGAWDVAYTDVLKDGKVTHRTGQFIFAWVLDGRALQDFWVVDPTLTRKDREVYTEVFYFDAKSSTWSEVSIDPQEGSIANFRGSANEDDRVVLESKDLVPMQLRRWSFSEIRPDSFVFHDEASKDDGKTWMLKAEYRMTRQGAAAATQKSSN
jgi:hypothetical protein